MRIRKLTILRAARQARSAVSSALVNNARDLNPTSIYKAAPVFVPSRERKNRGTTCHLRGSDRISHTMFYAQVTKNWSPLYRGEGHPVEGLIPREVLCGLPLRQPPVIQLTQ